MTAYKFSILSCVFAPEPVVSAQTSFQIARELSTRGNSVRVISPFPSRPAGKQYPAYQRKLFARDRTNGGFDILRCFSFFSPCSSMASRFLENLSFGITSGFVLLTGAKPDAVYANTWPIFAQGIISLICRMRRIPFVLIVQDIYPESLLAQNRIQNEHSLIFKFLRMIDTLVTRNSAAVIVISDQFRDLYLRDRHLPSEKVQVVPNWIDENELVVDPPNNPLRAQYKIPEDAFLVVYGGNVGAAAGVDSVVQALAGMLEPGKIYLLIAGDGSEFDRCQRLAQDSKNNRIRLHRPWLAEETSIVLGAADLCILPTRGEQSLVSVPSKLFSYMLAARPVLALAGPDSEVARIILDSACGWVIPPDDPKKLIEQIAKIAALPRDELTQRGKAGRDFVQQHYSKSANLPKVIEILEKALLKGKYDPANVAG